MLILLKSTLETLNYFIDSMAEGHPDAIILDVNDPQFIADITRLLPLMDETWTVVTFNNGGRSCDYSGGSNIWEATGVKFYNFLVDHPVNYTGYFDAPLANEIFFVIDKKHTQFINWYYPGVQAYFMPHGGTRRPGAIPWREREIAVLYCGSCQPEIADVPPLPQFPDGGRAFYAYVGYEMQGNISLRTEEAVRQYLARENITLSKEDEIQAILYAHGTVERMIRRKLKMAVIGHLAAKGIPIEIYGTHWEEVAALYPDLINVHERVSSDECVRLAANAKIYLNLSTYYLDGTHERVYIAMQNGAICLTEQSHYLIEKFEHGRDIVFLDYSQLDVLGDDVLFLLTHPDEAEAIVASGQARAAHSTWSDRLDDIIHGTYDPPTTP